MLNLSNFKQIPGYEDYLIDENGNIFSIKRNKILSNHINHDGYLQISLSKNGKHNTCRINRLVAQTFIPNPENLPQVNHKNGVKTDNRVENLEWVSASQNLKHAFKLGLKEKTRKACSLNGKQKTSKCLDDNLKNLFDDIFFNKIKIKEISKKYNISKSHIANIKAQRFLINPLKEYFADKDNVISININERRGNVRHLDDNLKNLFDDLFKNNLKTKDIAAKYNFSCQYIRMIKSKKFLQTALNEYFSNNPDIVQQPKSNNKVKKISLEEKIQNLISKYTGDTHEQQ